MLDGSDDHGAVVGALKDLVECVARIVCIERGETYSHDDVKGTIKSCLRSLGRAGSKESADDIRALANTTSKSIGSLIHLRNKIGSGHGRSTVSTLAAEDIVLLAAVAGAWVGWALARLEVLLRDDVSQLVQELGSGTTFFAGSLRKRLDELALNSMDGPNQHRIGVAVARRAFSGTFVVSKDGVRPLGNFPRSFPEAYVLGVVEGLAIDEEGRLTNFVGFREEIVAVLSVADETTAVDLVVRLAQIPWSQTLAGSNDDRQQLARELRMVSRSLPEGCRLAWDQLIGWIGGDDDDEYSAGTEDDNWSN